MPKQCAYVGCTSGKDPVWCPVLLLFARPNTTPARGRLSVRLCDDCRAIVTLGDLMDDRAWAGLLSRWPALFETPDRTLTQLDFDFVDVDDDAMSPFR